MTMTLRLLSRYNHCIHVQISGFRLWGVATAQHAPHVDLYILLQSQHSQTPDHFCARWPIWI